MTFGQPNSSIYSLNKLSGQKQMGLQPGQIYSDSVSMGHGIGQSQSQPSFDFSNLKPQGSIFITE